MPILYTWMRNPFCNFAFVLHWAIFPIQFNHCRFLTVCSRLACVSSVMDAHGRLPNKNAYNFPSSPMNWRTHVNHEPIVYNIDIVLSRFNFSKLMESLHPCISVASLCRQRASIRVLMTWQIARDFRGFVVTVHNISVLQQCICTDLVGRKSCVMEGLKFEDGQRWKKDKCTVCDCKVSSFTK